jgi:antirestriction protein ArdC
VQRTVCASRSVRFTFRSPLRARLGPVLPRRVTGETYRGVNVILLWRAAVERNYVSPYWLTFNRALKLGAQVRKGERGEIVVYYGQGARKRTDEAGVEVEDAFRFLKWYVVFPRPD